MAGDGDSPAGFSGKSTDDVLHRRRPARGCPGKVVERQRATAFRKLLANKNPEASDRGGPIRSRTIGDRPASKSHRRLSAEMMFPGDGRSGPRGGGGGDDSGEEQDGKGALEHTSTI